MKRRPIRVLLLVGVLAAGILAALFASGVIHSGPSLTPAQIAQRAAAARARRLRAEERKVAATALAQLSVSLPTRPGQPEPAIPPTLFKRPTAAHEVVGFVPYWTLPSLTATDYTEATILCFYGVSATASGSLQLSGPEWGNASRTLSSAGFNTFVASAHAAGDRVLLTFASADEKVISGLVRSPGATAGRLAPALAAIVQAHGLDGVNIDIEGPTSAGRAGYVRFVKALTTGLRSADPRGELMLDTYGGSAGNRDFFNVAKLAPLVDTVFVEGYDMNEPNVASASAPLTTNNLGYSEAQTLIQYTKLVPAKKLILGLPFYGNDFTTRSLAPRAKLKAADPEAVTYSAVKTVGRPATWDPIAASPYAAFQRSGAAHETYYDDPLSVAAKVALAGDFRVLGVGAWAFGMEGDDAAMLSALAGDAPVVKLPPASG